MKLKATIFVTGLWIFALLYVFIDSEFMGNPYTFEPSYVKAWGLIVFVSYILSLAFDNVFNFDKMD